MAEACYRKDFIACFGDPIDENPTVVIMEPAFRALGLNAIYNGALVHPEDLGDAVKAVKALHMAGANITVPHKVAVMQYLDAVDPDAALIGAVNTVYLKDGKACGANTDGKGFTQSLHDAGIAIAGAHVTILGAGGAAKAIAVELALAGCAQVHIINRTAERGQALAQVINDKTEAKAEYLPWTAGVKIPEDTQILINATNIGLYPDPGCPDIDWGSVRADMVVCDVVPNPPQTAFLKRAQALGCRTLDGLSMLVNQGVIGLKIWTGKDAPKALMQQALAKEFGVEV